jgi:hypothetical protein
VVVVVSATSTGQNRGYASEKPARCIKQIFVPQWIESSQAVISAALTCQKHDGTSEILDSTNFRRVPTPTAALSGVELGKVSRYQIAQQGIDSYCLTCIVRGCVFSQTRALSHHSLQSKGDSLTYT